MTRRRARFEGLCFRHSAAQYATVDESTLDASRRAGGRFNPSGEFGAVYVALEKDTALAELERRIERTGLPRVAFRPRLMLHLTARLTDLLDLTDPELREQFDVSAEDLIASDWTRAQEVGREARRQGYTAIRFPSATDRGDNLAIFLDKLGPEERLQLQQVEEFALE